MEDPRVSLYTYEDAIKWARQIGSGISELHAQKPRVGLCGGWQGGMGGKTADPDEGCGPKKGPWRLGAMRLLVPFSAARRHSTGCQAAGSRCCGSTVQQHGAHRQVCRDPPTPQTPQARTVPRRRSCTDRSGQRTCCCTPRQGRAGNWSRSWVTWARTREQGGRGHRVSPTGWHAGATTGAARAGGRREAGSGACRCGGRHGLEVAPFPRKLACACEVSPSDVDTAPLPSTRSHACRQHHDPRRYAELRP